jgi:glycosyltransferase involved in cell wall biosynthesis
MFDPDPSEDPGVSSGATPPVSIGLPVYNGEVHLGAALDSLLAQSYGEFELVVSDNHSTDRTEAICRDYAARDSRIRYHRAERNQGAAWNFNRTFELSAGRYFKWASSNDLHAPDYLSRCLEVLDRRPEVVLCYPKSSIIDDSGAVTREVEDRLDLPWPRASRRFREYLERVQLCNPVFGVIRSDVLRRTGRLGNYPGADVVLLGELTLHGAFAEVAERLFFRRLGVQNEIRDQSLENWQEFFDPSTKGRLFMRTWRHQYEYFAAVFRSPLPAGEKAGLALMLGRGCVVRRGIMARELAGAALSFARGRQAAKP